MPEAYIPIFLFILVAIGFAIFTLMVSRLVHASRLNKVKLEPYECGIEPLTDARDRYSVRYYLVAMLFIMFDIEIVFLYPWAVANAELGLFGFIAMLIFVAIFFLSFVYELAMGGLEWAPPKRRVVPLPPATRSGVSSVRTVGLAGRLEHLR